MPEFVAVPPVTVRLPGPLIMPRYWTVSSFVAMVPPESAGTLMVPPEAPSVMPRLLLIVAVLKAVVEVTCSAPPLIVMAAEEAVPGAVPRSPSLAIESVPPLIVVGPENVLPVLPSTSTPGPSFDNVPPPLIKPANVCAVALSSANTELLATVPEETVPFVVPLPSCKVPPEIVVGPVYVLLPASTSTPLPTRVRPPGPLSTPE